MRIRIDTNIMEIKNFTITKHDGSKDRFSLDKIMNAIVKAFESVNEPSDLGVISKILNHIDMNSDISVEGIQNQVENILMKEGLYSVAKSFVLFRSDRRHNNEGRPKVEQLCSRISDDRVCSLWSEVKNIVYRYIGKPIQYICCFFLALFALMDTETPEGKISHYWNMLKSHLRTVKIPSLRSLQNSINLFTKWKESAEKWLFSKTDKIKFKAWSVLQNMIEKLLPKLEPELATVTY